MRKFIIIGLLVAGGIIGWLYWQQHRPVPFLVSGFIEADEIRVGSRVGGRVAEVLASEGMTVREGEPLFTIDPFDLNEQLMQAEAQLAGYKAEVARLKTGYRQEEIEQARAKRDQARSVRDKAKAGPRPREIEMARERLKAAQADFDLAQREFKRITGLRESQQAAPTEYDRAQQVFKAAEAALAVAQQEVALLEEGTRKEEIAQAEAALAEAEAAVRMYESGYRTEDVAKATAQVEAADAQVAAIKQRIKELTVRAPCDCRVEAIDLRPGDLVAANAPSVAMVDLRRMWVRSYVPEGRLGEVHLQGEVPVRVDSFPGEKFHGRITYIAQEAEFTPRNIQTPEERSKQVFRVKVTLEGTAKERLRVGMVADVLFDEAGKGTGGAATQSAGQ